MYRAQVPAAYTIEKQRHIQHNKNFRGRDKSYAMMMMMVMMMMMMMMTKMHKNKKFLFYPKNKICRLLCVDAYRQKTTIICCDGTYECLTVKKTKQS
jgi:hypothetical protein